MKAGYIRVSTLEQNIAIQREAIKNFCTLKQWEYKEYIDEGVSGAKDSRPALNQLLEDMRKGLIDTIIVYKIDRLGRSIQHFLHLMEEFKNRNVSFISITQPIDTTSSAGNLMLQILAAFAEFERNLIVERVRDGKKRSNKKQGRKFKNINKETIFKLRGQGLSTYKIAEEYNKVHKPFISHQTVFNILKNGT